MRILKFLSLIVFSFILVLFLFSVNCLAFDKGAGGFWYGMNVAKSFFGFIPTNSTNFSYFGGYGYSVIANTIIGGFGFAIISNTIFYSLYGLAGGYGGLVTGYQIVDTYNVDVDFLLWLGLGGFSVDSFDGYFGGYLEVTLDTCIRLTRWMELVLYLGYQLMGNIIPGRPFDTYTSYTLTCGIRLSFGS